MAFPGQPAPCGSFYQGGYGGAPGGPAFPGQAQDPLYGYFAAVAGQDGQIDADELQRCLTQSGIAGAYKPFNLETCRLMISMLDVSFTMKCKHFLHYVRTDERVQKIWEMLCSSHSAFVS
uniref:Sorcin n=1 Tax=Hypotaenidia okinawae TaxID=2861861 RepID=A0A6G1S0X0_9GRUI